jgi:hypothetical protein
MKNKMNNMVETAMAEDTLFNTSSTTTSLRVILEATAATLENSGLRYSLNQAEMFGGKQR